MNEKFTTYQLIEALMKSHGLEQKDADGFVNSFFALIKEALLTDKYVKVKGLGTFKLIDVDRRESVSVNTGERIEIDGHTKIVFVPDSMMKNAVNKPFSHFETVLLNDGVVFDDMPDDDKEETSSDVLSDDEECLEASEDTGKEDADNSKERELGLVDDKSDSMVIDDGKSAPNSDEEYIYVEEQTHSHSKLPWPMILLALVLGLVIGGGLMWFMSIQKKVANGNNGDMPKDGYVEMVADSVEDEGEMALTDSAKKVIQVGNADSLLQTKEETEPEVLSDSIDYEITGVIALYTIQKNESLVKVSLKFYGSKKFWPYIAKYNKDVLKDIDNVPVGTVIKVPKLSPK